MPRLALGHHEIYLGPLLNPPVMERPSQVIPFGHPPTVAWSVPERPEEGLNFFQIADFTGPMWTVVAPPLSAYSLPDIPAVAGFRVLQPGQGSARFIRALAPNFNINKFSSSELSLFEWQSWTTFTHNFVID